MTRLRSIPNRVIVGLGFAPLGPNEGASVTSISPQRLRVTGARVTAEFPLSWVGKLARLVGRRIFGVRQLLHEREASSRARATRLVQLEHVAVDGHARPLDRCAELPTGCEISVRLINTSDRPIVACVVVQGELP
jgi:hypothetical protein